MNDADLRLYDKRDTRALGKLYTLHVDHLTSEGLHDKRDIAAELAWRDQQIGSMQARIDALMLEFCPEEMTGLQLAAYELSQAPAAYGRPVRSAPHHPPLLYLLAMLPEAAQYAIYHGIMKDRGAGGDLRPMTQEEKTAAAHVGSLLGMRFGLGSGGPSGES